MKKTLYSLLIAIVLVVTGTHQTVEAISQKTINAINAHTAHYDPSEVNSGCSATDTFATANSSSVPGGSSGVWVSNLQPQYILEQFVIETLKDVAKKLNVDEASAVTSEHVIALLAFMRGEGGDISNSYLYNPLNTGLNAPELVDGSHAANGTQSFKSFDAGVEGTARTIVKPQYSRLASTLTNQTTSAEQFMRALTYFQKFPNNALWAEASLPPNQDSYYRERLSLVNQVRRDYNGTAGLVIGTAQKEAFLSIRDDSKITMRPAGTPLSSTDTTSAIGSATDACLGSAAGGGGVVANNVAQTAVNFSWPEKWNSSVEKTEPGRTGALVGKTEYIAAIKKLYPQGASAGGADCGVFVSTVMRSTGADPNYPAVGTSVQLEYVRSHPEKYDVINQVDNTSQLQPGDIMIVNSASGSGHTFIFVGNQSNGNDIASASLAERMPNLGKSYVKDDRGYYTRARLK